MTLEEMNTLQEGSGNRAQAAGYSNTMAALKKAETSLPGYSGSYDSEIKSIYDKIVNRQGFKYEYSTDPVYGAYRDNYTRQGKLAMRDSMAQAANLTGGYGSSYAQSVGQQQYGSYLEKLNDLMPELYGAAYERYKAEGDRLNSQLSAAKSLAEMDYNRYADEKNRQSEKEKFEYQKKAEAYNNLYELIFNTGYEPSDEELENSGMSRQQAQAIGYEFMRKNGLLPVVSSGGGENYSYDYTYDSSYSNDSSGSLEQKKIKANT